MSPGTAKLRDMVARIRSERPVKRHDPYRGRGPFLTGPDLKARYPHLSDAERADLLNRVRRAGYALDYRLPPKSDPNYRALRKAARLAVWGSP